MQILDANGQALNKDMPREAIVGTGKKPTIAAMSPAQELAAAESSTYFHTKTAATTVDDMMAEYEHLQNEFFGMKWLTDYNMPHNEIQFRAADGEVIAKIINLKVPE